MAENSSSRKVICTDRHTPIKTWSRVKKDFPYIPIYVLLNNDREITRFKEHSHYVDISDREYITHIAFEEPLSILMDGKKRTSLITWRNNVPVE